MRAPYNVWFVWSLISSVKVLTHRGQWQSTIHTQRYYSIHMHSTCSSKMKYRFNSEVYAYNKLDTLSNSLRNSSTKTPKVIQPKSVYVFEKYSNFNIPLLILIWFRWKSKFAMNFSTNRNIRKIIRFSKFYIWFV